MWGLRRDASFSSVLTSSFLYLASASLYSSVAFSVPVAARPDDDTWLDTMSAGLGAAASTVDAWGMDQKGDTSRRSWVADMHEKAKKAKKSEGGASDSGSPSAENMD